MAWIATLLLLVVFAATSWLAMPAALAQPAAPAAAPAAAEKRHYAVTLETGFTPLSEAKARSEFPGQIVYVTKATVFGRELYLLRLGFFPSFAEATAMKDKVLAKYPGAWATAVTEDEFALASGKMPPPAPPKKPAPPAVAAPAVPPKPPAVREEKPALAAPAAAFALNLMSSTTAAPKPGAPLPPALKQQRLYVRETRRDGKTLYALNLGFFTTEAEAENARRQIAATYPNAAVIRVSPQEREESVKTAVLAPAAPLPKPPVAPPAAPTPAEVAAAATPETEKQAEALMTQGRAAIIREDYRAAIVAFNKLLALPPNSQSKDALEFLGLAYERQGDAALAAQTYERYLGIYREGEDPARVRQRLTNLTAPPPVAAAPALRVPEKKEVTQRLIYGGLSQYYYHGNSKIETQTVTANTLDRTTLSLEDQSALITNLDLNARYRSPTYDNRIVFRDTHTANFLEDQDNVNRLTAAYFEHKNKPADWSARLGRQPGNSGGVLGRFDGATLGYGLAPKWRINAVGGVPVEPDISSDRVFYGLNTEFGLFADRWSGNLYAIQQTVDDILDRQAVGLELRYTAPRGSVFSLVDYDTLFDDLNTVLVQANWTGATNTSYSVLADWRKTPTLQTSTAVVGENTSSIKKLLETYSEDELRQRAADLTAISKLFSAGLTHLLNTTWQVGGDVRVTNISSTEGTTTVPATEETGNVYTYTLQAIGTALFAQRDVTVMSASLIDAKTYDGQSYALTTRALLGPKWVFDGTVRWYKQEDDAGTTIERVTPSVRLGYRWKENLTFEVEAGIEDSDTKSDTTKETNRRNFYSLGYRWDF